MSTADPRSPSTPSVDAIPPFAFTCFRWSLGCMGALVLLAAMPELLRRILGVRMDIGDQAYPVDAMAFHAAAVVNWCATGFGVVKCIAWRTIRGWVVVGALMWVGIWGAIVVFLRHAYER